mgnify:FL=1
MSNELVLSVAIGATLRAGFATIFGRARNASRALGSEIQAVTRQQERLGRVMSRSLAHPMRNIGQMSRHYQRMGDSIAAATRQQERLNHAIARQNANNTRRQQLRSELGEAAAHSAVLAAPVVGAVKTFIRQETAETELKVAMMNSKGGFGQFEAVRREAAELGKELPGTTAEFYRLGRALKSQGLSDDVLIKGGLRTSAQLNVLLGMGQEDGGEFFAKMVEARGLKESEFAQAADLTQRAYFGFGLKREDMFDSMKYNATTTSILGLKGLQQYEKLLAIEGMGAQVGLEGSQFGTNFSQLLNQLAEGPIAMRKARSGMKAEANGYMKAAGVEFEFFDKRGNFKGLEAMVSELEKLNIIKQKLGEDKALIVASQFFGDQAARPAMVMAEKGLAGFQNNLKLMREQADLQARIKAKTATLGAALESLGGVAEQAAATFGSAFAPEIKAFAANAQNFIENTLQPWINENRELIKWTVGIVGGLLVAKLGMLGLAYVANMALMPFHALIVGAHKFMAVFRLIQLLRFSGLSRGAAILRMFGLSAGAATTAARMLGSIFSGGLRLVSTAFGWVVNAGRMLVGFLPMVGKAFMALGRFLLTTPLGIALTLMATAAYLLYSRWDGVVGGAKLLWQDLCSVVSTVASAVANFFANMWATVQSLFSSAISAILSLIRSFNPVSAFQAAFAAVSGFFSGLAGRFAAFGSMIIDGLVNGIRAKIGAAVAAVQGLGARIKSAFTGAKSMDMHSPSRVFKRYGGFIAEGLAIGVNGGAARPVGRIAQLAGSMKQRFAERMGGLRSQVSARLAAHAGSLQQARQEAAAQGGGAITVHFNPTINAPGGNPAQIETALQTGLREFEQLFERLMADRARRAY